MKHSTYQGDCRQVEHHRAPYHHLRKRGRAFFLAALCLGLLFAAAACTNTASTEPPSEDQAASGNATVANPMVEVADAAAVNDQLGLALLLPEGAATESCTVTDEELGEVCFTLDGRLYSYRGMISEQDEDISGLYYDFAMHDNALASDQMFVLEYNDEGPGYARWYNEASGAIYSVSVESGANQVLLGAIAATLIAEQAEQA